MSLIICSSNQEDFTKSDTDRDAGRQDSVQRSQSGLANPSTFSNFMRSPIVIDADSEVAVQSVRIQREPVYNVDETTVAYKYKGPEIGPSIQMQDQIWGMTPVRAKPGHYSVSGFREAVEESLSEIKVPGETFAITSNASSATQSASLAQGGHSILYQEAAKSGGVNSSMIIGNRAASTVVEADWEYYIKPAPLGGTWNYDFDENVVVSSSGAAFSSTGTDGHSVMRRNIASADDWDHEACAILKRPWSNSSGVFQVSVPSINDTPGAFAVGLTRPTTQGPLNGSGQSVGFNAADCGLVPESMRLFDLAGQAGWEHVPQVDPADFGGDIDPWLGPSRGSGNNVFYDYVAEFNETDLRLYHWVSSGVASPNPGGGKYAEVQYWDGDANTLTDRIGSASFTKTAQDANTGISQFKFELKGDAVGLSVLSTNGTTIDLALVDKALEPKRMHAFKPIGSTTSALYPKIQLCENTQTATIVEYDSVDPTFSGQEAFKYPVWTYSVTDLNVGNRRGTTITPGSDFWSCNFWTNATRQIGTDEEWDYLGPSVMPTRDMNHTLDSRDALYVLTGGGTAGDEPLTSTAVFTYHQVSNASFTSGIPWVLVMTGQDVRKGSGNYLADHMDAQAPNLAPSLGFAAVLGLLTPASSIQGAAGGAGVGIGGQFEWRSRVAPDLLVSSAFVKLRNGPQTSFNANLGSISKILYHIPRFTNDGRQYGDMFFEAGEKTYIAMKNPDKIVLNSLDIDIVDRNDRIVKDLSGNTTVCLHIRKRTR
mgnify:CR=1 FL=1